MHCSFAVVLLSQDERLAEAAHRAVCGQTSLQLLVTGTLDEAVALLDQAGTCALVAHLDSGLADEEIAQLLWKASLSPVPVPIVAIGDRYDDVRAQVLFQLGVTDYLGRNEHLAKLGALLTSALAGATRAPTHVSEGASRAALLGPTILAEAQNAASTPAGLRRFPILGEG